MFQHFGLLVHQAQEPEFWGGDLLMVLDVGKDSESWVFEGDLTSRALSWETSRLFINFYLFFPQGCLKNC